MENLLLFLNSIDWIFASVILIGGRYWGAKYFTLSKNPAINFLAFSTVFAVAWIGIRYIMKDVSINDIGNLFLTYLFTTSFYELLAKRIFEAIENIFGKSDKSKKDE